MHYLPKYHPNPLWSTTEIIRWAECRNTISFLLYGGYHAFAAHRYFGNLHSYISWLIFLKRRFWGIKKRIGLVQANRNSSVSIPTPKSWEIVWLLQAVVGSGCWVTFDSGTELCAASEQWEDHVRTLPVVCNQDDVFDCFAWKELTLDTWNDCCCSAVILQKLTLRTHSAAGTWPFRVTISWALIQWCMYKSETRHIYMC